MAKRMWTLEGFETGQFISWLVTTQAENEISAKLYDASGVVYFKNSKKSTSITPPLAYGMNYIIKAPLYLEVEAYGTDTLDAWFTNSMISSASSGKKVGSSFILAGEDTKGGDEDYNDIYANIIAWNKAD